MIIDLIKNYLINGYPRYSFYGFVGGYYLSRLSMVLIGSVIGYVYLGYLGSNNKRLAAGDSCNLHYNETVSGQPFLTSNDGEEIWEKLGRHHKNIQFILSGHVLGGGTGHIVSFGENGNTVFQITSNYQNLPNGGNGFLRTMEFLPENKIQVKTYSPYLDIYKTDAKNQFVIDLNRNLYKKE